ncbi:MAG TPA: tRNA (cytidine(34)-2'-O)-methyltransferase [Spirochaetota bacterium]|nr:tRNA (cytidine(34)-2'-O)-methyltransferase [Spirochaetota bacterium]HOL57875.1 tRNA (cytidine(34)-2'-O)-methyltransferase [Spirochaetota bacterium]HPP03912.1 tRNA (cytidine(34)-2'-O)-methyltransferase [Spirochaetota bacterium]
MISIALFEPQIPPNTGNIARLCVGLDIDLFLVGKLGFSIDNKYVKRAGLDYWEHLRLKTFDTLEKLKEENINRRIIIATTKGITPYFDFNYHKDDIILFGSETKGLPLSFIKENLKNSITIPMPGLVRSLNLSNSAAIIAYHALWTLGYFNNFEKNRNYYEIFSEENTF